MIVESVNAAIGGFQGSAAGVQRIADWSMCLAGEGYQFKDPSDPVIKYSGTPSITPEEIRVRLADIKCDTRVGMTAARSAYETTRFKSWIDSNATSVQEYTTLLDKAVRQVISRRQQLAVKGFAALIVP